MEGRGRKVLFGWRCAVEIREEREKR